jgi:hypothetical protein
MGSGTLQLAQGGIGDPLASYRYPPATGHSVLSTLWSCRYELADNLLQEGCLNNLQRGSNIAIFEELEIELLMV